MAFRFINFKVYKDAKIFHHEVVKITRSYKKDFYYLKDQMRRCSLSIVLNIAEGSAKRSDKDFNRYLENSMGSANELAAALDVSFDEKLIGSNHYQKLLKDCEEVVNQLGGFSKKLKVGS
jgi:four helix bundle protein